MDLLIAVGEHTSDRVLGMLGDPGVNVLELNVALDAAATVERESMSVSERRRTGTLRVYLGAAPGVGKTCAMLGEGHRRGDRGADVVVGFVETHGRDFTVSVDPGLPPVAADAALLERAVANLVSNAVTASRGHHPVGVEAGLVSAERLDLRIVDRGPGLPEEDRIRAVRTVPATRRPRRPQGPRAGARDRASLRRLDGWRVGARRHSRRWRHRDHPPAGGLMTIIAFPGHTSSSPRSCWPLLGWILVARIRDMVDQ